MDSWEDQGAAAADLALQVLSGKDLNAIPRYNSPRQTHRVDDRQLKVWQIKQSQLPLGTDVRFREFSLWEQYYWQITAAVLLLLAQAVMIAVLFIEQRTRRRARHRRAGWIRGPACPRKTRWSFRSSSSSLLFIPEPSWFRAATRVACRRRRRRGISHNASDLPLVRSGRWPSTVAEFAASPVEDRARLGRLRKTPRRRRPPRPQRPERPQG